MKVPGSRFSAGDCPVAQALGRRLHGAGSATVAYRSVRHERGQCVRPFKPRGASGCLYADYLPYAWHGERFGDFCDFCEKTA